VQVSISFLLKFFTLAAILFALWSFAGVGDAYGRAVITIAALPIDWITDCRVVAVRPSQKGLDIVLQRATYQRVMPLQPREAFSGLIPFLSLMGASAYPLWRRRLVATAAGLAIFFVFHIGLLLVGSFLTGLPQAHLAPETIRGVVNPIIDVIYGFYGLVGYAALPFLLWFALTREQQTTD
jgi:hypothetical protein